jgi:hypothetical protein
MDEIKIPQESFVQIVNSKKTIQSKLSFLKCTDGSDNWFFHLHFKLQLKWYVSAFQGNMSASFMKYFHKAIILHCIWMHIKLTKGFLL